MPNNPHLTTETAYRGAPITDNNPVILAFHGRGQAPDFVIEVFQRMAWDDAALVAPAAAENSWYPGKFMDPIETNQPMLDYALAVVDKQIADLKAQGVKDENLILLGFSQGACLIAEYGIRNPGRFGGMAILTGGVIGEPGTSWDYDGSFAGMPVFITTGETDEWVPVERVNETTALYKGKGAMVTEKIYSDRDHIVSDDEVQIMLKLFRQA